MKRHPARLLGVLAGVWLEACSGTGSGRSAVAPGSLPAIVAKGTHFEDAAGRHVILRGYNARIDGIFTWDTSLPGHALAPFGESEAARFEQLGLNVMRLCVNWAGIEPEPGRYDSGYLDRVDAIIELGRRHGFYVLVDFHQDGFSRSLGDEGAPDWAVVPPLEVAPDEHGTVTVPVVTASSHFFSDWTGPDGRSLIESFLAAARQIVARHVGDPVVVGYEAWNEPVVLSVALLDDLHLRFGRAVREIDGSANVFFEPTGLRNQLDAWVIPASPWPLGGGVYAPHVYTTVFSAPYDGYASGTPADLAPSMERARREAEAWGTPLFVGEFGDDQTREAGRRFLNDELDLQDRLLASSTIWVWQEEGSWGLQDGGRIERADTAFVVSRPFPRAVAGELLAIERPSPQDLVVRYRETAEARGQPHELSLSPAHLARWELRCDGVPARAVGLEGRAQVVCPSRGEGAEHTLELIGVLAR